VVYHHLLRHQVNASAPKHRTRYLVEHSQDVLLRHLFQFLGGLHWVIPRRDLIHLLLLRLASRTNLRHKITSLLAALDEATHRHILLADRHSLVRHGDGLLVLHALNRRLLGNLLGLRQDLLGHLAGL